ncbi:acyl-CoA dehydratase activase-related protein [Herbivorax sp. ANBcel31]|uniref:acyl-CoA dehydratase activase-related protein n=1 Tax=Herbivorax sp. ANBcel31 TaxID=3069754 RepID=UPI0027B42374|nr:acyl-CoA dehydratase activase-related protein [Herbivorax sp. ANBcel31]MDQ2087250.1 acyl-CoA dehydratase activase-related protein [Herbivorax sp. ANBcel31]
MITIGIPRALYYFQHNVLWEEFFKNLGCNVIVSDETNKQTLDLGVKSCSNETCLPVKVFHGHVLHLKDKVDYIFIPRYSSLDENEYACPKFCGLPDIVSLNLKGKIKVLDISVHMDRLPYKTFESLKVVAKTLKLRYSYVVNALKNAYVKFKKSQQCLKDKDINKNTSISILGHPYMIYDSYLSMKLIDKLKKHNINVYTPEDIDDRTKRKNAYPFEGKVFWEIGFELLGSAFTFAKEQKVKGIIYITPFACGIDAFIVEFIERCFKSDISVPFLKLTVDEHTGEAGFNTRLEAFLDMVG